MRATKIALITQKDISTSHQVILLDNFTLYIHLVYFTLYYLQISKVSLFNVDSNKMAE